MFWFRFAHAHFLKAIADELNQSEANLVAMKKKPTKTIKANQVIEAAEVTWQNVSQVRNQL